MKKGFPIGVVTVLLLFASVCARAEEKVRARPVLKNDVEYNIILLHVANHFVLTVPDDRSVDEIKYDINCSFQINRDGSIKNLVIENDMDGWMKTFEGQSHMSMWIRDAVLKGMASVPRFDASQLRNIKSDKKRTVVFSFGQRGSGNSTHIPYMGANPNAMQANLDRAIAEQREILARIGTEDEQPGDREKVNPTYEQLLTKQQPKWTEYTKENISESIRHSLKPDYRTNQPIIQKTPEILPPKTEVTITLQ